MRWVFERPHEIPKRSLDGEALSGEEHIYLRFLIGTYLGSNDELTHLIQSELRRLQHRKDLLSEASGGGCKCESYHVERPHSIPELMPDGEVLGDDECRFFRWLIRTYVGSDEELTQMIQSELAEMQRRKDHPYEPPVKVSRFAALKRFLGGLGR